MYSSLARLYILVLFCFGLSACLLFFCFVFCICICFVFFVLSFIFFFIYLECSTPFHGKIRAVHSYVGCLI